MARRMNWKCREISGITFTTERQVEVVDAETGRVVRLPRCEIDFGPRKVFVSQWAFETIYQPTIEKVRAA
jgi:hypothetical protein